MPETFRVIFTLMAAEHLEEVFDYIEEDSPAGAAGMIRRLLEAIDSLQTMPHRNQPVKGSASLGVSIRSMVVRPYLIRYSIDDADRVVTILSIRHGARRPEP